MSETKEISNPSWERQEGESSKAYAAFCIYRDYGVDRSIAKVVQMYGENGTSKAQLFRWSSKYSWVQRCNGFDTFTEQQRRKEITAYRQKMSERHAQNARAIQEKALYALKNVDPSTLSNSELLKYLESGMKIEKEAIGYLPVPEETPVLIKERAKENKMADDLLAQVDMFLSKFGKPSQSEELHDRNDSD
ncbi:MAG: hypothetical protein AB7C91_01515 [Sphaerochaeta sp.]|uniref:hypothetical protein n=1 Tax=Sphaerochaeta sp. TaxID=1972642 RepID=UPI003D0AA878